MRKMYIGRGRKDKGEAKYLKEYYEIRTGRGGRTHTQ